MTLLLLYLHKITTLEMLLLTYNVSHSTSGSNLNLSDYPPENNCLIIRYLRCINKTFAIFLPKAGFLPSTKRETQSIY